MQVCYIPDTRCRRKCTVTHRLRYSSVIGNRMSFVDFSSRCISPEDVEVSTEVSCNYTVTKSNKLPLSFNLSC